MSLAESRRRTKERFDRRNRLKTAKGRPRPFVQTPFGRTVTLDVFLEPLTKFLAGELDERPPKPPSDLGELVYRLEPEALALAALSPILDSIYRRRLAKKKRGKKKTSARMLLCKQIGEELRDRLELERLLTSKLKADRKHGKAIRKATGRARKRLVGEYLKSDWTNEDCVRAGDWLMQCAMRCYFDKDKDGLPIIAPEFQEDIDRVREQMVWRDQVHMPHLSLPPDWTGPVIRYDDRLGAKFVRDWRPETQAAISEAFRGDFEHARGVNALRRVPLRIDDQMLALVKEFAVDVMDHAGEQRAADERTVKDDVYVARWLGNQPFWLDYNCDKRGRIYAVQHLHFGREDHVRALFKFAHGMPLRRPFPPVDAPFPVSLTDLDFLAIHCANCQGDADKEPWDGRIEWTNKNRKLIQEIAASPADTFNHGGAPTSRSLTSRRAASWREHGATQAISSRICRLDSTVAATASSTSRCSAVMLMPRDGST